MKKIFALVLAAVAMVGCSNDITEDTTVKMGPRYTAPMAIDMNGDSRSFDADLNWVWDNDDTILAYQSAGGKHLNTLAILDNGKFGVESFGYDSQDPADFVFVHPAEAFNSSSYTVAPLQTGEWTPVLLGRASNVTIDTIESVAMKHLNAAVEFRFWEPNATARMNVTAVEFSSTSNFVGSWNEMGEQTLNGKSLSAAGLLRDNYTFNIGTGTFAFTLTITDENGATTSIAVPSKSYAAGSRTIINVEWKPAVEVKVSSWWTDQSKTQGNTIYVEVEMDRATDYDILLDSALATVVDGKITGVAPGEHTVRARAKVRDGYINSEAKTIMVTGIPTLDYTISSSYNNSKGTILKDNSKNGKTIYYTIGDLGSGDTNDYIQNNLVQSVVWTYGSTNTNVALNSSNSVANVALGLYDTYVTCTLKNGYVLGGSSAKKPVYVTGIPHLAAPPTEALGWSGSSGNVYFESSYMQIGGGTGSVKATLNLYASANIGVTLDIAGQSKRSTSAISQTLKVYIGGTEVLSYKPGSNGTHNYSFSKTGTLTSSNATIRCEGSYQAIIPWVRVSTLNIKYQ